jgi:ATP-dependent Clp protease adaptor protein ClpS
VNPREKFTFSFKEAPFGLTFSGIAMNIHSSDTDVAPRKETDARVGVERVWKVVVLNDPVNLMSYVVMVFRKVFGYDEAKARKHMLEVHERGRSVVWAGPRERAEAYVYTLQNWQLNTILEKE